MQSAEAVVSATAGVRCTGSEGARRPEAGPPGCRAGSSPSSFPSDWSGPVLLRRFSTCPLPQRPLSVHPCVTRALEYSGTVGA